MNIPKNLPYGTYVGLLHRSLSILIHLFLFSEELPDFCAKAACSQDTDTKPAEDLKRANATVSTKKYIVV